jgi:glycosyltransferase involved in cell wall biosynthesis
MMRVALDTNALYTTQAGVSRYIRGLLKGLHEVERPNLDVTEVAWKTENFGYAQPARALKTVYREFVWARFAAPQILRRLNPDILHSLSGFFVQPPARVKNVVTLHDLAPIRFPERFRTWQRMARKWRFPALHKVDAIICVSQFTADEAMKLLGLSADKLHVVHSGIDAGETKAVQEPELDLPDEFFLFVGSLEPGKNLTLLRDTYLTAEKESGPLPPLLIVGARWEGVARESKPPSNWRYLGRQPDQVLLYLYQRARALVFPSKYEGFGFPVLEAQANNCPVICSRVASLPEIGGDGALYVDQTPTGYLHGMRRILSDDHLRQQIVEAGRGNCAQFSWKKCAAETANIYDLVQSRAAG